MTQFTDMAPKPTTEPSITNSETTPTPPIPKAPYKGDATQVSIWCGQAMNLAQTHYFAMLTRLTADEQKLATTPDTAKKLLANYADFYYLALAEMRALKLNGK